MNLWSLEKVNMKLKMNSTDAMWDNKNTYVTILAKGACVPWLNVHVEGKATENIHLPSSWYTYWRVYQLMLFSNVI